VTESNPDWGAEAFRESTNVSRETLERLSVYADLLTRWQSRMNLVGASTLADLWRRHMLDSAQLFPRLPDPRKPIADLGSGAGFPGLVLAVMGAGDVHLVESNARKCAFLREVIRATGARATVHNARIEAFAGTRNFDVVTARACAPLTLLLEFAEPLLSASGICLFLKGAGANKELTEAEKKWKIELDRFASITEKNGCVLQIGNISRRELS
jgi:16S rRNA (guanine527-N7)-methyltransferase